jgi:hypothetical protein
MRDLMAVQLDELDAELVQLLPQRETLCELGCVNVANVIGVNIALGVNAATISSSVAATAQQYLSGTQ